MPVRPWLERCTHSVMLKYQLEFVLAAAGISEQDLLDLLKDITEEVELSVLPQQGGERSLPYKVTACVQDPTIVFDACAEFGRIRSVKIEEVRS